MSAAWLCSLLLVQGADEIKLELPKTRPPEFALAKASQDGKSIALTQKAGVRYQTYTVQVPMTVMREDKDGNQKAVTVMRTETRQRAVQVGRRTVTKMVEQTYVVMVPTKKTRKNKEGKEEEYTVMVPEQRTRRVPVTTHQNGAKGNKPKPYKISECKFTDLKGQPVEAAEVARRLEKKSPIVLLYGQQKLDPFYAFALKPDMLVMTPPAPKPTKQPNTGGGIPIPGTAVRDAARDPRP